MARAQAILLLHVSLFLVVMSPALAGVVAPSPDACVRVYFDAPGEEKIGAVHAMALQNLLGHFPRLKVIAKPIETYSSGQIEECRATFYIGSVFDNAIPESFLADYATTKKAVAWLGYSIWRLPSDVQAQTLGIRYSKLTELDSEHLDSLGRPTFYRDILYKGEVFEKHGEYVGNDKNSFAAAFEISAVEVVSPTTQILAEARHNFSGTKLPYAIRNGSKFFIADVPFSYLHESDRYLVFADLLFDILSEKPRHEKHMAVFRLEDVHAKASIPALDYAASTAKKHGVTLHIATIPVFTDPYGNFNHGQPDTRWLKLNEMPEFAGSLKRAQDSGARLIWHGVTHQYSPLRNPTGSVGDDWEFWDYNSQAPVPEDSVNFVLERLSIGWKSFRNAGFKPMIWEVPHYQASALDYILFGRLFSWNIGRINYQLFSFSSPSQRIEQFPESHFAKESQDAERMTAFADLSVKTSTSPFGQFFPYEIYRDVYGQRVLPENLGNVQAPDGRPLRLLRSVDDILRDARRNLVLRDAWASFYYHPQLLETEAGRKDLDRLLSGIKDAGYEFVDLEAWIQTAF